MTQDWNRLVLDIEPQARMTRPATETEIARVESAVGARFPTPLRDLLLQTNGVLDGWWNGPIWPLEDSADLPFRDASGTVYPKPADWGSPFPSISAYTLRTRSEPHVQEMGYEADAIAIVNSFVTIGMDAGGGQFGFFAGAQEERFICYFAHLDGVIEEEHWTLEEYLRFYFTFAFSFER